MVTLLSNDDEIIARAKLLFFSNISLSVIITSNIRLVCPAGNVTVYGPES